MRRRPTGHAHVPVHAVLFLEYVRGPRTHPLKMRKEDKTEDNSLHGTGHCCLKSHAKVFIIIRRVTSDNKPHDVNQTEGVTSYDQSAWHQPIKARDVIWSVSLHITAATIFEKKREYHKCIEHRFPQVTTLLQLTAPCWLRIIWPKMQFYLRRFKPEFRRVSCRPIMNEMALHGDKTFLLSDETTKVYYYVTDVWDECPRSSKTT